MKKKIFLNNLEKIFEIKKNSLSEKTSLESIEWDSLKILELMAYNDANFKIKTSPDRINKCKTFGDIIKLYKKEIK